ncbi:prolyl oligopeptidase family serine peptidase [Brevifollis gellanilyticus]|uniref:prolyl oligopeptidase n=1 Tax=Brevifollis gellanilyticus TaxID=748831 RepID=A0A512MF06_9BACT|nr:prolyl oligopeptidase family serine peptidase [Brevifollis gellanilyticus]GEP45302.1 prolyl endopeptidase [Brevifollis gellanilyticus]
MKTSLLFALMPALALAAEPLKYPATRQDDKVSDDYFGTKIADPYRWLEDDNSEETKAWVKAQNEVTFGFLKAIPKRDEIRDRLQKAWNYERTGIPFEEGGKWFLTRNSGLQNQGVLFVTDSLDQEARELLDPNKLSKDGTTSLTETAPSKDGKLLVYGVSKAGSDWQEFRVKDIATGKDKDDLLEWIKFSGASWAKDSSGFYYSRFPKPKEGAALTEANKNQTVYFHKLGTPQSDDKLIYARPDQPDWGLHASVTEDGAYLIYTVTHGTDPKNRFFYQELGKPDAKVVELLNDFDASYSFIDNIGSTFYFHTDLKAPRYRVIAIDLTKPARDQWRELIPEGEDKLDTVTCVGGQFLCKTLKDARSAMTAYDLEGKKIRDIELPGIGTVGGFGGKREDKSTHYVFTSFTTPGAIYRYDVASGKSTLWKQPKVDFDASPYETKQVFVKSKDGTKVPMFLVYKKGLKLDGNNATLLYGYGGFDISLTPNFSIGRAIWLELGGVYALANLRGGGEYGADWHLAGTKLRKQNVFDDFIACAEWLQTEKYTSSKKLAIMGGSNGGLLVGACMAQRPELYGAALPAVGVMDMLRFHKFTIGWAWKSDYGSSENADEFKAIVAYSPLHNLKPGTRYPATMVTTADHDDRVVPAHSFKFAARLQESQSKDADAPPVLIRIETSAGHGAGTALTKVIEETADEWAFLWKVLGME